MNTKIKVAIIEDDQAIARMYAVYLEQEGFEVATAADGVAGLKLVGEFLPDVILLDIMMPNMNGLEMLAKLRETSSTRVIVLTNLGDVATSQKLYELKANDYIIKSDVLPRDVALRIRAVLTNPVTLPKPQ